MEMRGEDISHLEPPIRRFFQFKPPTHGPHWVPIIPDDLPWTSPEYEPSVIFGDEPKVSPSGVSKPHQVIPAHSTLPPEKEDHKSTEATAVYSQDDEGICMDDDVDNLVDLDQISHPGTDPPDDSVPFPDRLQTQIEFWRSIHAPTHIIQALEEGVDIGLIPDIERHLPPEGINRPNMPCTSMSQVTTRREKVAELLRRSIVGKRTTRARINLGIMLIAKPDGKFRFIWNGKPLSPYLTKTDFSYELLSRFLEGVLDGSELGKLDLVDGFFALKIKPSQRQYLGFSLENEHGVLEFYEFWVLPQGITTAPYIFSRFTLAITTYLRRTMLWVIFITYLDDLGWAIHPDCTPAHKKIIMDCIRNTFISAGWVLSPTKCVFESGVTSLALLGFLISTTPVLTIDLSTPRKTKLLELLDVAIAAPATTLILRAKICGGLQSGELSLGPSVTLYLRYNYMDMATALGDGKDLSIWHIPRIQSPDIMEEWTHWRTRLQGNTATSVNRPPWRVDPATYRYDGYTDASGVAVGSVVLPYNPPVPADVKYWYDKTIPHAGSIMEEYGHEVDVSLLTPEQRKESSTMREQRGLFRMTMVHLASWTNHSVRLFTDNSAVAKIMTRGSRVEALHRLVRELVALFDSYNIRATIIWIPRKDNGGSDKMSRQEELEIQDIEDYTLSDLVFQRLSLDYGGFTIDMFANASNAKCQQFINRHADIGSVPETIDAFFQPYWGQSFYAFPPVDDAPKALKMILNQNSARGLLILPLWVRLTSYSQLFPDGSHFIPQVKGWSLLSARDINKGPRGHASFLNPRKGGHRSPFIAILINTDPDAATEYSDVPSRVFCLKAYYGEPRSCNQCAHHYNR